MLSNIARRMRTCNPCCCKSETDREEDDEIGLIDNICQLSFIDIEDPSLGAADVEDAALSIALCEGDVDFVRSYFSKGMGVNQRNSNGESPLHVACERGHQPMVEALLEEGADVNRLTTRTSNSPLQLAAAEGHREVVRLLLDKGANMDLNRSGQSALYMAGKNAHFDIVQDLVERGANVNLVEGCPNGFYSPLYLAAADDNSKFVTLLLDKGAKVNQVCRNGETALHVASEKGHYETVEILLSRGADVNRVTVIKGNKLSDTPLFRAVNNGHSAIVALLLNHQAECNWPNRYGETPLYAACRIGDLDTASLLLEKGAKVDLDIVAAGHNPPWHTPLYLAAWRGHAKLVALLLDNGADVNRPNRNGYTPLYAACVSHHFEIMRLLIDSGAELNENILNILKEEITYQNGVKLLPEIETVQ